ncbi:MAG TPA: ABC transporter substrate-binding protein [Gaiellaceae bacterium]|jgi:peptide/nickel transport system substrate-binding protein
MSTDDAGPETSTALTRRQVLERGAALGLAAGAAGTLGASAQAAGLATPKPKRGGTLRVALIGGGGSNDNLDPHATSGSSELSQSARQLVFSKLTDMQPDGSFALQAAASIEPNKNATVWQIKLKKGITFSDGSPLTVDDVIWTYKRILNPDDPTMAAARGNIDMIDPNGMKKVDKYTMTIKLKRPWSDMFSALGQRYLSIIKNGSKPPWTVQNFIGTGAFKLTSWTPGAHYTYTANRGYFETGKPYLNALDIVGIPDPVARVNALVAGQVDCICSVPAAQVPLVKRAGRKLIVNPGGSWTPIVMNTNAKPFTDPRVRQAMKLLIDRKQAITSAAGGYADLGNDLFARHDPLYNGSIPQRAFDPEKAKALLKSAGALDETFTLYTSDAVSGAVPMALVFEQGAKKAGVKVSVETVPASSFWDTTWGHQPFTFSSWGYRSFFTQWVQSFASFNAEETQWNDAKQRRASRLVYAAAATSNKAKQKALTAEAQQLQWDDGGYIIPYFAQTLDAATTRVQGIVPHVFPFLSWYRMWNFWLS